MSITRLHPSVGYVGCSQKQLATLGTFRQETQMNTSEMYRSLRERVYELFLGYLITDSEFSYEPGWEDVTHSHYDWEDFWEGEGI